MDPALTVVLFAAAMSTVTAFVAYWAGVGAKLSPTVERLVGQAKAATAAA